MQAPKLTGPLQMFWDQYQEAERAGEKEPFAVVLATASKDGQPSARIVYFREWLDQSLCFFTNYRSRKARDLDANPKASFLFFWPQVTRQVRMEGRVARTPTSVSDAYWNSRPRGSQLASAASPQSDPVSGMPELEARIDALEKQFEGKPIPRPEHWGGFAFTPEKIEFWKAGTYRMHEREIFTLEDGNWRSTPVAP